MGGETTIPAEAMQRAIADTGPDGAASLSRPRSVTRTGALRMDDETYFDALRNGGVITDKQHAAADELHALWVSAGLAPRVCARYNSGSGRVHSADDVTPLDLFRAAMRRLTWDQDASVSDMLWGRNVPLSRIGSLRAGLDVLGTEVA